MEGVPLGPVSLPLGDEEAGRIDFVDTPAGLRSGRDVLVGWHCVNGTVTAVERMLGKGVIPVQQELLEVLEDSELTREQLEQWAISLRPDGADRCAPDEAAE